MNRGDVVILADRGGDFTGKPRPAVVVRANVFNELTAVTVCPLTSIMDEAPCRVPVSAFDELPLATSSKIAVDKITTVRGHRIGKVIGRLSAADVQRLDGALLVYLGIG
jgi:mRNA interferase MazF